MLVIFKLVWKLIFSLKSISSASGRITKSKSDTVDIVQKRQQKATTQWEKLLEITGGALKPSKCYWYLVQFKFNQGEWGYVDTTKFQCKIQGEGTQPQFINSLPVDEPMEIMGVWQNLAGDNKKQVEETIKKHLDRIRKIQTSSLEKKVVWKGMIGVIWASMRYGLPAYTMTKE